MAVEPTDMNAVLDLPMQENDADATTVRDYLGKLLELVWRHGDGFSGKRPFGNSGWHRELYPPLVRAGFVEGSIARDGYDAEIDGEAADRLIREAITSMRVAPVAPGAESLREALGEIRSDVARARAILARHDSVHPGEVTPA